MPTDEDDDIGCLERRRPFATVPESLANGGQPVAAAVVEHVGAVLRVEPGGPDDEGWPQVTINVYERVGEGWIANGGGGFDWDWPIGGVPDQDEASADRFGTPLNGTGRGVWLIPHYGPTGAWLEAVLDEAYPWQGPPHSG